MVGTNSFDYAVWACGIIALIIVVICYFRETRILNERERLWREEFLDCPPPSGLSDLEKTMWLRQMCEEQINKKFPTEKN